MSVKDNWFTIHLALIVTPEEESMRAMKDLEEELINHSYFRNPKVVWDSKAKRVVVQVEIDGPEGEPMAKFAQEVLFEAASAVLMSFQRMRVEVIKVDPAPTPPVGK